MIGRKRNRDYLSMPRLPNRRPKNNLRQCTLTLDATLAAGDTNHAGHPKAAHLARNEGTALRKLNAEPLPTRAACLNLCLLLRHAAEAGSRRRGADRDKH